MQQLSEEAATRFPFGLNLFDGEGQSEDIETEFSIDLCLPNANDRRIAFSRFEDIV